MQSATSTAYPVLRDYGPQADTFLDDVLAGLRQTPRTLPSKYFYDARGSQLFDRICELDEYYPTRTELAIMEQHLDAITARLGPRCLLVEYGSGSSLKTRLLLDRLCARGGDQAPAAYIPIDISRTHLMLSARALAARYPGLPVLPVAADYTQAFELPAVDGPVGQVVVYFPGSTIGNFTPAQARAFMEHIGDVCGPGGGLLIGVDLKKDAGVLWAAYNDAAGVTAAFNKNLLVRINRELGADFDVDGFVHEAIYDPRHGRIEMHLVCTAAHDVHLADSVIPFRAGERIVTEYSYKYAPDEFAALAAGAGFVVEQVWTDARDYFSVQFLRRVGER